MTLAAVVLDAGLLSGFVIADPKSGLFIIGAIAIVLPIGFFMSRRRHQFAN